MAQTISQLFQPVQLPNSPAVLFSMPAVGVLKNGRLRLTNTSGSAVPATLYAAAAGTASGVGNCFLSAKSIAANDFIDIDLPTLTGGDTLRGFASTAGAITMHEMGGVIYS